MQRGIFMKVNKCVMYLLLFSLLIAFPSHAAVLPGAGEWSGWTVAGDVQDSGNPEYQYAAPAVVSVSTGYPYFLEVYAFDTSGMTTTGSKLKSGSYILGSGWAANPAFWETSVPLLSGKNPVGVAPSHLRRDLWVNGPNWELYQTKWTLAGGWDPSWNIPWTMHLNVSPGTGPAPLWQGDNEWVFYIDGGFEHLYVLKWTGSGPQNGWENPVDLGVPGGSSYAASSPSVCYDSDSGDIFIFVRKASDNKLWYYRYDGSTAGGGSWVLVPDGSDLAGAPSAISRCPGTINVFYRTPGDEYESILVYRQFEIATNSWSDEVVLLDFVDFSDPAVGSWGESRLDVFIQYTDGTIEQNTWIDPEPSRIGVFRNSTHSFYLDHNGNGVWDGADIDEKFNFGLTGDIPVSGNWDGRFSSEPGLRTTEIGVFRPSTHTFYLDWNGNGKWDGAVTDRAFNFGLSGDIPLSGDWRGFGTTEIGVFRPSTHMFYLDWNGNGRWDGPVTDRAFNFGLSGDVPVSGEWSGSGRTCIGVYRPLTHTFYLDYNGNGKWDGAFSDRSNNFGLNGDFPISGDWDKSGKTRIGVFRPSTHTFYLDWNGNGVWNGAGVDRAFNFGLTGDKPVSGVWS